ncbi:MAG: hypothetical protein ABSG90_11555 [Dehalococcoidia bacterium]|jgi:hypothetical protein
MGYLAATDVIVTVIPQLCFNPPGQPKVSFPTIAFGDGASYYPAHGVPLPAMGALGDFLKKILRIIITPPPGDGYVYKYDKNYGTIRIYEAPTAGSLAVVAVSAGTPAGNVAVPTGNLAAAGLTIDAHAHTLKIQGSGSIAANDTVGVNGTALVKVNASDATIAAAGADSGVQNTSATGNLANTVLTIAAPAFTGSAMGTHTHSLSGEAAVGALVEFTTGAVAPTASLDLMVIGE